MPGRSDLVRVALRLIVEEALEGEVVDALGRERYARGEGEKAGYRNSYCTGKVKTAKGAVEYAAPQVRRPPNPLSRGCARRFRAAPRRSRIWRSNSTRAACRRATSRMPSRPAGPKASVARGGERDYREAVGRVRGLFQARSFRACDRLSLRRRHRRTPPSGAETGGGARRLGIGADRRKVLLALMAGSKEDVETVRAFFQDLRARGLGDPSLVVSDGAPGIIRAIEEGFPRSARQRCLAHRMRNLAIKVSADLWPEFKARVAACYQEPS